MAKERDRLQILKEIDQTERAIARERANENELIEIRNKKIRDHKKEILNLARELKKVNQKQEESYADSEKSISQISDAYSGLKESQKEGLTLTMDAFSAGSKQAGAALKIADINRQISELGRDDIQQRAHLLGLRDDEMAIATEGLHGNNKVVQSLKKQNSIAENYANLTDYQKFLSHILILKKLKSFQFFLISFYYHQSNFSFDLRILYMPNQGEFLKFARRSYGLVHLKD